MLDPKIDITCPSCARKFQQPISRLKNNAVITCPGCHKPITIKGGTDQAVAALDRLDKALKGLGKRR